MPIIKREGRNGGFVRMGTEVIAMFLLPTWMIVSNVYVYELNTLIRMAASRLNARNPLGASGIVVLLASRTIQLPILCNNFFENEKWLISEIGRAPTTISI